LVPNGAAVRRSRGRDNRPVVGRSLAE